MPHLHGHGGSHAHSHAHPHSHGVVDREVLRSRAGVRAVLLSLGVLAATAAVQAVVYVLSGSVALLADLVHNAGDALTAIPVGAAFLLRSERAERWAGYAVVLAIFVSACVALYETILRLIEPRELEHLLALAGAGVVGVVGNEVAARIRLRAGRRLASAALVADGNHARVDAYVSLGVVASAAAVALGLELADPLIGLAITLVILRITWASWRTVRGGGRDAGIAVERTEHGIVVRDARRYDRRMWSRTLGREGAFRDRLVRLARVAPGDTVVDVGCGTGGLALAAKRRAGPAGHVLGIDPSPEMVARARAKARRARLDVEFEEGVAQRLPAAEGSVDVVLATLSLHELPGPDLPRSLAEMRRVLAPGGRIFAADLDFRDPANPYRTAHGHGGRGDGPPPFDLEEVEALLRELGLEVLDAGPVEFRLRGVERLRYVLGRAPAAP